jgi:hypothetical protein
MEFGLNKAARLAAERKAAAANKPLPLDPPFPYEPLRFPQQLFGVRQYSDAPPEPTLTSQQR